MTFDASLNHHCILLLVALPFSLLGVKALPRYINCFSNQYTSRSLWSYHNNNTTLFLEHKYSSFPSCSDGYLVVQMYDYHRLVFISITAKRPCSFVRAHHEHWRQHWSLLLLPPLFVMEDLIDPCLLFITLIASPISGLWDCTVRLILPPSAMSDSAVSFQSKGKACHGPFQLWELVLVCSLVLEGTHLSRRTAC